MRCLRFPFLLLPLSLFLGSAPSPLSREPLGSSPTLGSPFIYLFGEIGRPGVGVRDERETLWSYRIEEDKKVPGRTAIDFPFR